MKKRAICILTFKEGIENIEEIHAIVESLYKVETDIQHASVISIEEIKERE